MPFEGFHFLKGFFYKVDWYTSPKTNMDTQNDGLEKVDSFKIWPFLVSTLVFVCVVKRKKHVTGGFLGLNMRKLAGAERFVF